jgi:hypothetical protein
VELKFARQCANPATGAYSFGRDVPETTAFREQVLSAVFQALVEKATVKSLTIGNLQDHMTEEVFGTNAFKIVRKRLTKLHLQIATEDDDASPERNIEFPACHQGFRYSLPEFWLKPTTNQLTHLSLYGRECYWGLWPFTDLRDVATFPHLESLSLGNFAIAHDWQIDWITSHGSTLQELCLDDCSIVFALSMSQDQAHTNFPSLPLLADVPSRYRPYKLYFKEVDLRWHHVLERFRIELPRLRYFAMGHGDWLNNQAFEGRYNFDCEILNSRYMLFDWTKSVDRGFKRYVS